MKAIEPSVFLDFDSSDGRLGDVDELAFPATVIVVAAFVVSKDNLCCVFVCLCYLYARVLKVSRATFFRLPLVYYSGGCSRSSRLEAGENLLEELK